jgi:hypothetical protein
MKKPLAINDIPARVEPQRETLKSRARRKVSHPARKV